MIPTEDSAGRRVGSDSCNKIPMLMTEDCLSADFDMFSYCGPADHIDCKWLISCLPVPPWLPMLSWLLVPS